MSKLRKPELAELARRLNITNFSALTKQALIDRIIADCAEADIAAAIIDVKLPGEKEE